MSKVRPKKHLGQHFLANERIAARIADSVQNDGCYDCLVEIGPGTGVLTKYLFEKCTRFIAFDVDRESVEYLNDAFPSYSKSFLLQDFLKFDLTTLNQSIGIVGNFPYNISSQIFFHVLQHEHMVCEVVGMLQKEVAERICAGPGSKTYGILSVLLQTYYDAEYLFTVKPANFNPPPKVNSGVIRLLKNERTDLGCEKRLFFNVVKTAFQKRRKTLRNALKPINLPPLEGYEDLLSKRAEQLSPDQFIQLTIDIEKGWKK